MFLLGMINGVVAQEPYAVLSDDGQTVTFYYDTQKANRENVVDLYADWGGVNSSSYNAAITAVFDASFADYRPTNASSWFANCHDLSSINGIENLNTSEVTKIGCMFYGCSSLKNINVNSFNTARVTNMNGMFAYCSSLESLDLSNFVTSNVENIEGMFEGCSSLKSLDLSNFDTSNVEDMSGMFESCSSLKSLDLSNFVTSKVEDMFTVFAYCSSIESLDLSNFDTSNVKSMSGMFENCSSLKSLDLSNFDTTNVKYMDAMFEKCSSLINLNLCNFKTANVESMTYMFFDCPELTTIFVDEGNWNTENVSSSDYMFSHSINLVGGNGTKYDENHTDYEYARVDKPGQPGYLTQKSDTGISGVTKSNVDTKSWYTLEGVQIPDTPTKKGIYIVNGRKTAIH